MKNILVLMGGHSTEREVSLRSGAAVTAALQEAGFQATALDLTAETLPQLLTAKPDLAFLALHGKGGEDGSVQGLLEWLGIPYTGPDVAANALCLNKILTKKILMQEGIPTPRFLELGKGKTAFARLEQAMAELGLPLVLKAACQGSSIGTAIVRKKEEAEDALREILSYGDRAFAEEYLSGKELTVPILGNEETELLPVIQILSQGEFYDYRSKYAQGGSRHVIPAPLDDSCMEQVKKIASRAYLATGCSGFARVDVMLSASGEPYVIEINTCPGMTETSLFPDAARAAGMTFPQLVTKIVKLATEK